MCGIAGYFGTRQIEDHSIQSCLQLMYRRGPDHRAFRHWVNSAGRNVYLLHTRLSIIDLDPRANQPFSFAGKSLVYNGELYNYLELREELKRIGHSFLTQSDTEVMLHLLHRFGRKGLERSEGMWAFALYDEKEGTLLLARDRFGEKPLYLFRDPSGIYFGSEIKFIASLLGRPLKVNPTQLYRYWVNGYKSLYKQPSTFFEGVTELAPASSLHLTASGKEESHRYWQPSFQEHPAMSYEEAVTGVRERLIESVRLRLRADVPLAFCMSGGVDSNSLIGIAKHILDYDVEGFTIVNSDARYEEQDMVNYAVKELGIRHTSIPTKTEAFLPRLKTLVRQHDAPVYTITYFAHWMLMESIAEHGYRISISGTAADELFTGYYDHHLAYLKEVSEEPLLYANSKQAWNEHIRGIVRNPYLNNPDRFIENPEFRDHIFFNAEGFTEYLVHPWSEDFTEETYTESLLRNRMMNEMFHESVPLILHEDDLNAMYFSIENRSPYLDRELFDFCYTIPSKYLIREGRAKAILRDAVKGIVPERILLNRRKVGFNAPIRSFLDLEDPKVREYLLDASPIYDHLRRDKIESLLRKSELLNSESKFLFSFLSSKLFLEEFA